MSGKMLRGGEGEGAAFSPARAIVWGVAFAIGIPIVLLGFLHLPLVQGVVLDTLIRKIEDRTDLKIRMDGYNWRPLSQLDLEKLSIRNRDREILECERARVTYALSVWRPFVYPEEIHLEKPVIHVEQDERGRWQIPRPNRVHGKSGESGLKQSLRWNGASRFQVRVAGGTVLGWKHGDRVLTIRNISGILPILLEFGEDGPRIKIDLGEWQTGS